MSPLRQCLIFIEADHLSMNNLMFLLDCGSRPAQMLAGSREGALGILEGFEVSILILAQN